MSRSSIMAAVATSTTGLVACGELAGFGGAVPPLATIRVEVTGELASVQPPGADHPALHVALVWGAQWLVEPLCILPPDDDQVAAALDAGCRDPFGFVPERVGLSVPLEPDRSAALELFALPAPDVMVGDVTARIAYASLVAYDDRDGDGTLTFARAARPGFGGLPDDPASSTRDLVYAASFVSMTEPDTRLAFREGGFDRRAAFYPRSGCGDPLPSFSIVSAGGFAASDAITAALRGELPREDPATCRETSTDTPVAIALRPPAELREIACTERRTDSSVRYREPPQVTPDFTDRTIACARVPDFGTGRANGMIQLVVSGRPNDSCRGITHYVLRGCRSDALCESPQWDITAAPPSWWPCPVTAQ